MNRIPHCASWVLPIALVMAWPAAALARPAMDEQVEVLHREIAALRVVHNLDLDEEQRAELIPLVETGIGLVGDLEDLHEQNQRDHLAVLQQVRDDLWDDGELDEATEAAAQDARKAAEKALRPVMWELGDLSEEVMQVLDEDQREAVQAALSRPPGARKGRGGPEGRMGGPRAGGPDEDAPSPPPGVAAGIRRHNARQLFHLVFSDEFLQVLTSLD